MESSRDVRYAWVVQPVEGRIVPQEYLHFRSREGDYLPGHIDSPPLSESEIEQMIRNKEIFQLRVSLSGEENLFLDNDGIIYVGEDGGSKLKRRIGNIPREFLE